MPKEIASYRTRGSDLDGFAITLIEQSPSEPFTLRCAFSGGFSLFYHPHYDEEAHALVWERRVARSRLTRFLHQLGGLSFPALPTPASGLDGTTHEFTIYRGFHRIALTWWGRLPTEWTALQPLVSTLERLADIESVQNPPRDPNPNERNA